MSKKIKSTEEAVAAFIEGSQIQHTGLYIDDKKMVRRGLVRSDESVRYLDQQGPNARDILRPLLDHEDEVVRITAAGAVFRSHQDAALSVIEKIADTGVTEAYISAKLILSYRRIFGHFALGIWDDPRFSPHAKPETTE